MTEHTVADAPTTVWELITPQLPQKAETPIHWIARALGTNTANAQRLLQSQPTLTTLLELHRLAAYHHLALADRLWPHCALYCFKTSSQGVHQEFVAGRWR